MDDLKILGAGPAGLTSAINLVRAGKTVKVFEKRAGVGMRFHENMQGLRCGKAKSGDFFRSVGVRAKIETTAFPKVFVCTRTRELELDLSGTHLMEFVKRGGKRSLEYALFKEAEKLGVAFEFNSHAGALDADIVATGISQPQMAATGTVFEDDDFPRDHYAIIFDDRYSPRGWYSYLMPIGKGITEFVTCVSRSYIPKLQTLHEKAIAERRIVRDFVGGKKRMGRFGGSGGADLPSSAIRNGQLLVGEAAGFQDPYMGFGIVHAMKSGKLAADSLAKGLDYDALWKKELGLSMKKDFSKRFAMSVLGDYAAELAMRKYRSGQKIDMTGVLGEDRLLYRAAEEIAFAAEIAKKKITGEW